MEARYSNPELGDSESGALSSTLFREEKSPIR